MVRTDADLRQPRALAHRYIQCCTNALSTALPKTLPCSQSGCPGSKQDDHCMSSKAGRYDALPLLGRKLSWTKNYV